jgi:energy-coupling factor transporter transmembrane protein EcfT
VFFVNATVLLVVVVFFAVAGRIIPVVIAGVLRVKCLSEFLQNPLTGLTMQPLVLWMTFQLVFEIAMVGNLARFFPDLSRVIVGDVPEFAGAPPVPVERVLYLSVVEDFRLVSAVDFQHP